ncbi:MAG: NAD(P)/FAD-dependent oxidoreductase [Elusimicrobiota bacterium]|jgi:all-trans-retinol 13,14-reductase|nr:NAD(P)/FAD-dependent oxidoreductase [Elusimicrobiota bacterium]
MLKEYDSVVIGGGISGLTSALLLAQRGKKTAILEAGATISPIMNGFSRKGVHFETGFHYASSLGEGDFGHYIFNKLGLDLEPFPLLQDGYDEIHILPTGRVFKMAYGKQNLANNLHEAFPEEKKAITAYLDRVENTLSKSFFLNMHKKQDSLYSAAIDSPPSLQEVLDEYFKSPELKAILSVSAFLHGTPPSKISFGQHCRISGSLYKSAWGIKGGGLAINKAYKNSLERNGADIFVNAKAVKIEYKDGKKHIFTDKGGLFVCNTCISTVHPKIFLNIAPKNVYREGYKARINELEETPGFFTLYAILKDGKYFKKSNMFVVSDTNINGIFSPDMKTRSYYINFSNSKPQALSIISLVPPSEQMWDKKAPEYNIKKEKYAEILKKDIASLFPEIADSIEEYLEVSTPATTRRFAGYYSGYGLMHDVNKTKILPITKIPGLYISGRSIIAPGLLGAIITALLVDKIISKST